MSEGGFNSNPNLPKRSATGKGLARNKTLDGVIDYLATVSSPQPIGNERGPLAWTLSFPAIITNQGPQGENDFFDERYWVFPQSVDSGSPTNAVSLTKDLSHDLAGIVVATNIGEQLPGQTGGQGTHKLPVRMPVRVFLEGDQDGAPHYVFFRPPNLIPVLLTSTGSNGSATSRANYVYSAHDADDPSYVYAAGGTIAVSWQRPLGALTPATIGLLHLNGTNAPTLWWADEVPQYSVFTYVSNVVCNGDGTMSQTTNTALAPL